MSSRPPAPVTIAHRAGWVLEHRPEGRELRYRLRWTGPGYAPAEGPQLDEAHEAWGRQTEGARWVVELALTVSQAATGHFSKAVESARKEWADNGERWPAEPDETEGESDIQTTSTEEAAAS